MVPAVSAPSPPPRSDQGSAALWSWLFAGLVGVLYLAIATQTVQGGDTAEFVTVAAAGGVAHPPGYPLFQLLAQACAAVLPGPIPWRVSAATVLCAAATVGVLHRVVLRWTGDGAAAAVAALALAGCQVFAHWSTAAEVLPGGTLTTLLVVAAALMADRGARGPMAGLLVGLAAATGIANHHTVVLLLPLCVFGWVTVARGDFLRTTAATTAGVAAGFLPYLLLLGRDGAWVWGDVDSLAGLVHHFLRRDYGSLSIPHAGAAPWWTHPLLYLRETVTGFAGVLWLLAPLGAGVGLGWLRRGDDRELARPWLTMALLASWLLAGPLLLSRFTYPTDGFFHAVVERFHLQPHALLAVLIGVGATWVLRLPFWSRPVVPRALLLGNGALLLLWAALTAGWAHETVLEDFLHNALESAEEDALLITSGDAQTFGFVYAQEVLGLRPDVAAVAPQLLPHAWYRERLLARHPDLVLTDDEGRALPWVGLAARNLHRPVHVSPRLAGQANDPSLLIVPWMPFLKVVPPGELPPPPTVLGPQVLERLDGFRFASRVMDAEQCRHTLECTTWDHYALVLSSLATGYRAAGDAQRADAIQAVAAEWSPWLFEGDE